MKSVRDLSVKLLLIDDDELIYNLINLQIKREWGNACLEYYNPAESGIPDCFFNWDQYDIVLLDYDLGMNDFNGIDLLSRLSQSDENPIVVMITGEGCDKIAVKAIQAGADDYLVKGDIATEQLYDVIENAICLKQSIQKINNQNKKIEFSNSSTEINNIINLNELNFPIIAGYECLSVLNKNISKTYLARRLEDDKKVVLKVIEHDGSETSNFVKRFNMEFEILSRLDHPHVIKILDYGISESFMYYAMEYIEYGDMEKLLLKGPVSMTIISTYFNQILQGINSLHSLNIIHRDIKPNNILIKKPHHLVIADLGSAKDLNTQNEITLHGEIIGTPFYMSPEQFNGSDIDLRSDIYSLGILFYEMMVGKKPFIGENIMEIVFKHAYKEIPLLPDYLDKYQEIINRMLAKNPDDRFQNINELLDYFDRNIM